MEQTKKKSRAGLIIAVCIVASVVVLAGAVLTPYLLAKSNKARIVSKKYVTEYDLDYGERAYKVYRKWNVSKEKGHDGSKYLYLWVSGEKEEPKEYLTFKVYNSSSEARRAYESYKDSYDEYRGVLEEGNNWFAGWEPYVCDASIYSMICLKDNILIMAELDIISEWAEPWPDENEPTPAPQVTEKSFDRSTLKDYVLDNTDYLEDYVLNRVLDA